MIAYSCEAGATIAGASAEERKTLHNFGLELGLAFQIVDDLLDVEGDERALGKSVGKDAAAGKATFVSNLGVEGARREALALVNRATARLRPFGMSAKPLHEFCEYLLTRRS